MKKIYTDSFILHDESEDSFKESQKFMDDKDGENDSEAVKSVSLNSYYFHYISRHHYRNTY